MIASLDQIKELLHGETCELRIEQEPPPVGRATPLQPAVGKRARCRVLVCDHWPHREGGHVVLVEVVPEPHRPRLLRPSRTAGDYTTDPKYALHNGHEPEPEAVDAKTQEAITANAAMFGYQENARRRIEWEKRSIVERLEDEIREAERLGVNPSRELARLEAGLSKLARRNAIARKQRQAA